LSFTKRSIVRNATQPWLYQDRRAGHPVRTDIDGEHCVGHGMCHLYAPDVYDQDEDGHGVVRFPVVPESLRADARAGAEACPQRAITIEE
jgi:ferredoxin